MSTEIDSANLLSRASQLIDLARKAGADAADAVVVRSRSQSVSVRLGKVEGTEASESDDFSLRVFVGNRVASVSANPGFDLKALAERAVAMAKASPEDPFACLADEARSGEDLSRSRALRSDGGLVGSVDATQRLRAEEAALAVPRRHQFRGCRRIRRHGRHGARHLARFFRRLYGHRASAAPSASLPATAPDGARLRFRQPPLFRRAGPSRGHRPHAPANGRSSASTRVRCRPGKNVTVVFDPRVARGFVGHIAGAINGASVARKTSFLRDMMGKPVLKAGLTVTDDPLIVRGSASRPFDGEGVSGKKLSMIEDGVLKHWFLSTSTAREIGGLKTNGRGVRGGTAVSPSSTNLALEPGDISPEDLIRNVGTGFYVTELIGQGVNMMTGEYSRGASGFWIENGELTFPVSEVTIASNLKDMFMRVTPANDIDRNFGVAAPTLAIEGMTLAGE